MNCFLTKQTHHWKNRRVVSGAAACNRAAAAAAAVDPPYWAGPSVGQRRGRTAADPSPGGSAAGRPSWSLQNPGSAVSVTNTWVNLCSLFHQTEKVLTMFSEFETAQFCCGFLDVSMLPLTFLLLVAGFDVHGVEWEARFSRDGEVGDSQRVHLLLPLTPGTALRRQQHQAGKTSIAHTHLFTAVLIFLKEQTAVRSTFWSFFRHSEM